MKETKLLLSTRVFSVAMALVLMMSLLSYPIAYAEEAEEGSSSENPTLLLEDTAADTTGEGVVVPFADPVATVVNKDNFLTYFQVGGNANYNQTEGLLTLTTADPNQAGSATLKRKISMNHDWQLDGELYVGILNGADGVTFGFHEGGVSSLGRFGAGMGLQNLPRAFAWEADTYLHAPWRPLSGSNTLNDTGVATQDPNATESTSPGYWAQGGFSYTDPSRELRKTAYNRSDSPHESIADMENGLFHPITITYTRSTGRLSANFRSHAWSIPITTLTGLNGDTTPYDPLSFFIGGSTEQQYNLQRLRIGTFTFHSILAELQVTHVDQAGRTLAPSTSQTGNHGDPYTTSPATIPGYRLITNPPNANGSLSADVVTNVVYVYALPDTPAPPTGSTPPTPTSLTPVVTTSAQPPKTALPSTGDSAPALILFAMTATLLGGLLILGKHRLNACHP